MTTAQDLLNKALSTDSDAEAAACVAMLRKKYKNKKVQDLVSPSSTFSGGSSPKITNELVDQIFKRFTLNGGTIHDWEGLARRLRREKEDYKGRAEKYYKAFKKKESESKALVFAYFFFGVVVGAFPVILMVV